MIAALRSHFRSLPARLFSGQAIKRTLVWSFWSFVLSLSLTWIASRYGGILVDVAEIRCLPHSVYLAYPVTRPLHRGDYVSFRASNREMLDLFTGQRIIKMVAAVPGDHVVSNASGIYINGVKTGERNPISLENLSKLGKAPQDMDRVLVDGELVVMGTLPRAFDSRYWGVLPAERVDRLALPVY